MKLRLAYNTDQNQLINIWKICFNDMDEAIKLFFCNRFKTKDCVVCELNSKIVASLYMFDASIKDNNGVLSAFYIYAAGTLPNYRGKGYMKALISYANSIQLLRNKKCSFLLPANDRLYGYYNKLGYKKFFKSCFLSLSNSKMKRYVNSGMYVEQELDFNNLYDLRTKICSKNLGSIIWDKKAIDYAFKLNDIYGGKNIILKDGYAICILNGNNLEIVEFFANENSFNNLMKSIYNQFPKCNLYKFKFSKTLTKFFKNSIIKDFGMIKFLDEELNHNMNNASYPYLGLTLD